MEELNPHENTETPEEEIVVTKALIATRAIRSNMELELQLQQTGPNTEAPTYEELLQAVEDVGAVFGISEDALRRLADNPSYGMSVVAAHGKEPQTGENGWVDYLVEKQRELRPKERDDGTVDYRDLGFIQNVEKGQVLCEIHHPVKGEDGMDIMGEVIEGRFGKEPVMPGGKNTEYNEDKTQLLAAVSGTVEVNKGIVSVIDQLCINGNVDNSTGDLDFVGNIIINGDVISGFNVTSQGNILIKGSVEGATVKAVGDITVNQGINGMDRGSIIAGGNLKCQYIQSCTLKVAGNIYADAVMYCNIECLGNVELKGKRGRLIGGKASIGGVLSATTIGTSAHISTTVAMCVTSPDKDEEIRQMENRIKQLDVEELKFSQIMARYEDLRKQNRMTQEMQDSIGMLKNNIEQLHKSRKETNEALAAARKEQARRQNDASINSYIICKAHIHAGVSLVFGLEQMTVSQSFVNSRVVLVEDQIKIMST